MYIEFLGFKIERTVAEGMIEALIDAINHADGDAEGEVEYDEDDMRSLAKL